MPSSSQNTAKQKTSVLACTMPLEQATFSGQLLTLCTCYLVRALPPLSLASFKAQLETLIECLVLFKPCLALPKTLQNISIHLHQVTQSLSFHYTHHHSQLSSVHAMEYATRWSKSPSTSWELILALTEFNLTLILCMILPFPKLLLP